jgi:DNA-binding NarL/FixJ family response regulator
MAARANPDAGIFPPQLNAEVLPARITDIEQHARMQRSLRALMIEDSEADAEFVTAELERAGFDVTADRVDSREAFAAALRDNEYDVVLCGYAVSGLPVRTAPDVLRNQRPTVPLIVITGNSDNRTTVECLRHGADDVVAKEQISALPAAITAALTARRPLSRLTPRQLQVLRLVAEGHSTPEIAARLRLSAKTIETHRTELMKRLNIHDVVRLVRYAVRVGMVAIEP